ncbi:uncharacterized protein LOC129247503 [Anastrepha obliqua]|uniref:uncharacterized protein LOC129247503 n=1 Tax=Anastrepha obliqua TaxID=95512 RepID=UPI0024093A45|nr:uncharacterized protein LOC129247503 [Anastrepha obliqua]
MWKLQLILSGGLCVWFLALFAIFPKQSTMEKALSDQRKAVANEIASLKLLNQSITTANSKPVRSVLVTSWLSGSDHFVKYFHRARGYYQHFAPLFDSSYQIIREPSKIESSVKYLKRLLYCDYNATDMLFKVAKKHFTFYSFYGHQRKLCRKYRLHCWNRHFLSEVCKMYPFQMMPIYRMRLKDVGEMLNDTR